MHLVPRHVALALGLLTSVAVAGCSDDGGSVDAFCETAREFATDNPAAVFDRYDPGDPASAVALLEEAGDRLRAWADDAPKEIDDDVETIARAADDLALAFSSPDPGADDERTAELQASFTQVEAASVRVTSYTRDTCEVDLDAGAPPVTPAPGSEPSSTTAAP